MIILYLGIVYYNTLPKKRTKAFRLYIKNEKLIPKGDMTFSKDKNIIIKGSVTNISHRPLFIMISE